MPYEPNWVNLPFLVVVFYCYYSTGIGVDPWYDYSYMRAQKARKLGDGTVRNVFFFEKSNRFSSSIGNFGAENMKKYKWLRSHMVEWNDRIWKLLLEFFSGPISKFIAQNFCSLCNEWVLRDLRWASLNFLSSLCVYIFLHCREATRRISKRWWPSWRRVTNPNVVTWAWLNNLTQF